MFEIVLDFFKIDYFRDLHFVLKGDLSEAIWAAIWVWFFVSFIWVFSCFVDCKSFCSDTFSFWRDWNCFFNYIISSSCDLIFSSKSLLASRLFSSSVLITRFFDSKAVFNCVVSLDSFFNACRKLPTCEFKSAADCNCTVCSLASFSSFCSFSMCSSQSPNDFTFRL